MMIKLSFKKTLIKTIFPILSAFNKHIPKNEKSILIHCSNGILSDNALYLFEHLIDNQYNNNYKIFVSGKITNKKYSNVNNVLQINKLQSVFCYLRTKYVFYAFGKIPVKPSDKQCVINLTHGTPLKTIGLTTKRDKIGEFYFNYVCGSSEYVRPYICESFGCDDEHVFINGEPRIDAFFKNQSNNYENNLILWLPTMRQSSYFGYNDSEYDELLPLLPMNCWDDFNDHLKQRNINVIAKIHPYQDLNGFTEKEYSNFKVYSSGLFEKKVGDVFEVEAPAGLIKFEVLEITRQ